jgi:hypothetical protein
LAYPLRIDSSDAGAGITRIDIDHRGWPGETHPSLAKHAAPCDPRHRTAALEARVCPEPDAIELDVDTTTMPEGTRRFRIVEARVADAVGNWSPTAGATLQIPNVEPFEWVDDPDDDHPAIYANEDRPSTTPTRTRRRPTPATRPP